jgi:hypothetical protein
MLFPASQRGHLSPTGSRLRSPQNDLRICRIIDHLHRRVMAGGQRIHDTVPDACPPTNEATIASGAGTIGFRQIAPGAPERKTQEMPFRTRRSLTRGMPRGLFGRNDLMAAHSKSVSSYRTIRGPDWALESRPNRCLQPAKPDNHISEITS